MTYLPFCLFLSFQLKTSTILRYCVFLFCPLTPLSGPGMYKISWLSCSLNRSSFLSVNHSLTHSLAHLFQSFTHSLTRSSIQSFTHSSIQSFTHSLTRSSIVQVIVHIQIQCTYLQSLFFCSFVAVRLNLKIT